MPNPWVPIKDGDLRAFGIYRRHYSARPKPNGYKLRQFVAPCVHMVLLTVEQNALWVWTAEQWRKDGQVGLNCAVFRNEGERLSSDLILSAEEWAWDKWTEQRVFTYIDGGKIRSVNPGYCFKMAGWQKCGSSSKGLTIMEKDYA